MARAPWNDPAVLSLGRLPMTGVPHDSDLVDLDGVHRGVGTAACGPDTLETYVIRPGIHRWRWTISTQDQAPEADN